MRSSSLERRTPPRAELVDTTIRLMSRSRSPDVDRPSSSSSPASSTRPDSPCLEVSGGGVFDSMVRRGVESPWERIRALKARTKTPLGMALRGRFLVGSRPVRRTSSRRFVSSAADNGIDVFRLHDPLNDVSNLREAGEAVVAAGREFDAGLVYSPGTRARGQLVEPARDCRPRRGACCSCTTRPGRSQPHQSSELVARVDEASGLPVGLYCQGAGGTALAAALEAARAGADLIACAVYPSR